MYIVVYFCFSDEMTREGMILLVWPKQHMGMSHPSYAPVAVNLYCVLFLFVGVFSQNRLLIVVNKLDRLCFSGIDEADVTWVEVAEKVHKYIKKICACSDDDDDDDDKDIPKKAVIPICSKWAYEAQMLKQDPTSEKIRRSVKVSLNNIPSNETTPEGSEELADSLLDFSNIMELEKR